MDTMLKRTQVILFFPCVGQDGHPPRVKKQNKKKQVYFVSACLSKMCKYKIVETNALKK